MGASDLNARIDELASDWKENHDVEKKDSKIIHDGIHGTIELEDYIASIVDLPPVQRLREINQLGPVDRVYPTASHTRFEHSLGVYHVASQILNHLHTLSEVEFTPSQEKEVKAAAILHDIGHLPFSHMSERILEDYSNILSEIENSEVENSEIDAHEFLTYKFLKNDYFRESIEKINNIYGIRLDIDSICKRIIGETTDLGYDYLTDIIHGPIDADRLDYLQRDNHNIGFPSVVDADRLISTLVPIKDPENDNKRRLGIEEKGLRAAESLFVARDRLGAAAHEHHVTLVSEAIISRCIVKKYRSTPYDLVGMTDYELHAELSKGPNKLFNKYKYRQLPKRYVYFNIEGKDARTIIDNLNFEEQLEIERDISNMLEKEILIIKSGMDEEGKSGIGDALVKFDNKESPLEVGVELNRKNEGKGLRETAPRIQIHVNWKHLQDNVPGEDILMEIAKIDQKISDELDLHGGALTDQGYRPKSYQGLL